MACTASGWRWSAFDHEQIELRAGFLSFRVTGKGAARTFQNEGGGHRWQRVPPSEKRGRVQTSTVTVAILQEPRESELRIDPSDQVRSCQGPIKFCGVRGFAKLS